MDEGRSPEISRREFVKNISRWVGWGGLAAIFGGISLETLKFFVPKVSYEKLNQVIHVGHPWDYDFGVSTRWQEKFRIFVIRTKQGFYALDTRCTGDRCTVNWFGLEERFKCPCRGDNFNLKGDVVRGSASQPLRRYQITLDGDEIIIDLRFKENREFVRDKPPFFLALK